MRENRGDGLEMSCEDVARALRVSGFEGGEHRVVLVEDEGEAARVRGDGGERDAMLARVEAVIGLDQHQVVRRRDETAVKPAVEIDMAVEVAPADAIPVDKRMPRPSQIGRASCRERVSFTV